MKNGIISEKLKAQIDAYQALPYSVGQRVVVPKKIAKIGGTSRNEDEIVEYKIVAVNGNELTIEVIESYSGRKDTTVIQSSAVIKKDDYRIGFNPFKPKRMPRIQYYNIDIWQLLGRCGYAEDGTESGRFSTNYVHNGVTIKEINFDPYVYDKNGVKHNYQRGLVWTLKQKQAMIQSIYDEQSIGTFMLRHRAYNECIKLIQNGETEVAFYDLVDGKQRLTTLIEFIRGEFTDKNGNSFGDFSEFAKRTFFGFDRLSFGMIDEGTPDESVIFAFLNITSTGTPVNPKHLAKIKQIKF